MPDLIGDVIEQYQYRAVSVSSGIPTRVRGFRVVGMNVDQAINVTGVPRYKEAHPDFSGLVVRDINTSWQGCDTHVVVTYVPSQYVGVNIPPVDQFAEDFIGIDITFDDVTVDIPLYQQTKIKIGQPPTVIEKDVWQRRQDVMPYQYSRSIVRIDMALELDTASNFGITTALSDLIEAQINKIHRLPNGRDYLFKPEGMDQRGEKAFNITYRWYSDPGVPNTLLEHFGTNIILPPINQPGGLIGLIGGTAYPFFDENFLIPPFNGVRIDGDKEDAEAPPKVTFFERFDRSMLTGWATLPGII